MDEELSGPGEKVNNFSIDRFLRATPHSNALSLLGKHIGRAFKRFNLKHFAYTAPEVDTFYRLGIEVRPKVSEKTF